MEYRFNEASVTLPAELIDKSLQTFILADGKQNFNVVISRVDLESEETLSQLPRIKHQKDNPSFYLLRHLQTAQDLLEGLLVIIGLVLRSDGNKVEYPAVSHGGRIGSIDFYHTIDSRWS
jgi:hypothetical protein